MTKTNITIGVVTVSDRASRGEYEDKGGPAIRSWLEETLISPWRAVSRVVPDEQPQVEAVLKELCDEEGCCLVVTTGGTGPAPRDITPEATEAVCDKILDGFGEQMRAVSLQYVPTAMANPPPSRSVWMRYFPPFLTVSRRCWWLSGPNTPANEVAAKCGKMRGYFHFPLLTTI